MAGPLGQYNMESQQASKLEEDAANTAVRNAMLQAAAAGTLAGVLGQSEEQWQPQELLQHASTLLADSDNDRASEPPSSGSFVQIYRSFGDEMAERAAEPFPEHAASHRTFRSASEGQVEARCSDGGLHPHVPGLSRSDIAGEGFASLQVLLLSRLLFSKYSGSQIEEVTGSSEHLPQKAAGSSKHLLPQKLAGSSEHLLPQKVAGSSEDLMPQKVSGSSEQLLPHNFAGGSEHLPQQVMGSSEHLLPQNLSGSSGQLLTQKLAGSSEHLLPQKVTGCSEHLMPQKVAASSEHVSTQKLTGSSEHMLPQRSSSSTLIDAEDAEDIASAARSMFHKDSGITKEDWANAFDSVDEDSNGVISRKDMYLKCGTTAIYDGVLKNKHPTIRRADWLLAFDDFDINHDGKLSVEELATSTATSTVVGELTSERPDALAPDSLAPVWPAGRKVHQLRGHIGKIYCATVFPSGGKLVTGSMDKSAIIWDVSTGVALARLEGNTGEVMCVAVSADEERLITGCSSGSVVLWNASDGVRIRDLTSSFGASDVGSPLAGEVRSVALLPSSSFEPVCNVRVISGRNLRAADIGGKSDPYVICRVKHAEGNMKTEGCEVRTSHKWRTLNPVWEENLQVDGFQFGDALQFDVMDYDVLNKDDFLGCATIPGESLASRTFFATELALTDSGQHGSISSPVKGCITVKVSVDKDERIATAVRNTATIWSSTTGCKLHDLEHDEKLTCLAAFPIEFKLLTANGKKAIIWHFVSGVASQSLDGHEQHITSLAVHPSGDKVMTGSMDMKAFVWDARTARKLYHLEAGLPILCLAVFHTGSEVVTITHEQSGSKAAIWSPATGQQLTKLEGDYTCAAVFPSGSQVVTAGADGAAIIWAF